MLQSRAHLAWMDVLKGIAIILVVIGHTKSPLSTFIYSFHMPLFFIVGGFLFNFTKYRCDFSGFVKKKFRRLVVPYLVSSLVIFYPFWYFLARHFGETAVNQQVPLTQFLGIFYATGIDYWMQFNLPPWFLTCMFVSLLVFWGLHKLADGDEKKLLVATILTAAIGYVISFYVMLPWSIDIALVVQVFMIAGWYLRSFPMDWRWIFVSALVLAVSISVNGEIDTAKRHYENILLYYLGGIAGTILMMKVATWMDDFMAQTAVERFLAFCGRNSLMILLFHSVGFKFSSVFFVYILKIPLATAHVTFWPIYAAVSLIFCIIIIQVKQWADRRLNQYAWWTTFFAW